MEFWELWACESLEELVDLLRENHDERELISWLAFQSTELKAFKTIDPSFRATITPERFWIREWSYELHSPAQVRTRMAEAGTDASIADLWVSQAGRQHHLLARFIHPRQPPDGAVAALVEWAGKTGYTKVFLPDRVLDPEICPDPDRIAEVDCASCGTIFQREGFDFWGEVVEEGRFPTLCEVCGAPLPQWEIEPVID